ncbi:MAG TPA: hypothetical protein VGV87_09100 [Blastocatellia bacterium]|jgi:hypothetical protein|nr:hypothetical protein [Blastocatellia bacterium]
MTRIAVSALILLVLIACGGGGPKRIGKRSDPYIINSTLVDPSRNAATFSISVASESSQDDVKTVAELVISTNKAQFKNITVKTYLLGSDQSGVPYATSMLADNVVTHWFNPQATPQKIPTH